MTAMQDRHTLLVQLAGLVLRGLAWGALYGAIGGATLGTFVFPILGTVIGAYVGGIVGFYLGVIYGVALAGYVGFAGRCLKRSRVALARTFPLVALVVAGGGSALTWVDTDDELALVLNIPKTIIALAASWFAARSIARWYLSTEGYTPEEARAALHYRPRVSP